jgi:endonuclease YncB( thermonuclease family)
MDGAPKMTMIMIAGGYRVLGAAPDGDSVRFYPTDPDQWDLLRDSGHQVRRNAAGGAQLRLDGIDATETHFSAGRLHTHQPLAAGHAASVALLSWLGFHGVRRNDNETVTDATPAEVPGYIFSRGADIYGRCVAFAGRGDPPAGVRSGKHARVTVAMLRRTVNYRQVQSGLAYPTFYRKLYVDLRTAMAAAAVKARARGGPLWSLDATTLGAALPAGLDNLQQDVVIMPKLFRRLVDYFALNQPDISLSGFPAYLAQRDDRVTVLPTGQWTGLDTVVTVKNQTVRMTVPPEHLVFDER